MSNRLNKERQAELEPRRMEDAKDQLELWGYEIVCETNNMLQFYFKDHLITFWPYSGWASGKTIKDGRGAERLFVQIKP